MTVHIAILAAVVALTCVTGACAPSLRELAVRVPYTEAGYTPSPGDSMAGPLRELRGRLEGWGVQVSYETGQQRVGGAIVTEQIIALKEGLPVDAEFEVLAHEAGHLFQPHTIELRSHAEAFAEGVALGIADYYGHPYRQSAARYLAGYKMSLSVLDDFRVDIDFAVKVLTGQVMFGGWWR